MDAKPPLTTDPARELADLLTEFRSGNTSVPGSQYLAERFEVEPWSQDFYRVISTIMDRLAELKGIIRSLPLDLDYQLEMVGHVDEIATAFTPSGFQNAWQNFGADKLSPRNVQPLKSLSGLVRQTIEYRRLSTDELSELVDTVGDLTGWLEAHQLIGQDFVRQALIDGLKQLTFRLVRFKWLGWGYSLDALRDVIAAYMLLERGVGPVQENPDAHAALRKVATAIKTIYDKTRTVKTVVDTGDWLLKAYGVASLALHSGPSITALLPG